MSEVKKSKRDKEEDPKKKGGDEEKPKIKKKKAEDEPTEDEDSPKKSSRDKEGTKIKKKDKVESQPDIPPKEDEEEENPDIWSFNEPYRSRLLTIEQLIAQTLLPKKDLLKAQLYRIEYRADEIRKVKSLIEKDIRAHFLIMLERLNSAEGSKISLLEHDAADIKRDIDRIDDLIALFGRLAKDVAKDQVDQYSFFGRFGDIAEGSEFAVAKPFKSSIEVTPYDLPRELTEQKNQLQRLKNIQKLLSFKDEVIYQLVKKQDLEKEAIMKDLEKTTEGEFTEWARLTDNLSNDLIKFQNLTLKLLIEKGRKECFERKFNQAVLENAFKKLDPNLTGSVGYDEFKSNLRELDYDKEEIETLQRLFDPNGEGRIAYDNFIRLIFEWSDQKYFDTFRK